MGQKRCYIHFQYCILLYITSKQKELETRGWSHIVEEKKIFFFSDHGYFLKIGLQGGNSYFAGALKVRNQESCQNHDQD